jgi:hypothetical protein
MPSGTFEFIATSAYSERPPMPPAYDFIIDTSSDSLQSGYFASVIETIKYIINNSEVKNPDRSKFAFITYDSSINFIKILSKSYSTIESIQQLCVSDDDIFLPCPVIVYCLF